MREIFILFCAGIFFLVIIVSGCKEEEPPLFEVRTSEETGLTFNNVIQPYVDDTFNVIRYVYIYNGGGVGTGDFNNDGLLDLYFAGNIVSSKLFLNKGELKFEDITEASHTGTETWATGISVVDINEDGWSDIYVCVAGKTTKDKMANLLFVHQGLNEQGIPVFKEEAAAWGLADTGYSTMATFFDYDKDGDLDLYLLTNSLGQKNKNDLRAKFVNGELENTDRLYRNNGDNSFTNVSREAGILVEGWGLGVCVADLNLDGWPDIYVANDFVSNDLVWINQGDGSFINKAAAYFKHQTYNAMGVDVADYNNDLLPDIVVLDMLPRDNFREKIMIPGGGFDFFRMQGSMGYQKQYIRNTLQLNQGMAPSGDLIFSEIGYQAGIFRTDWSWAPLMADYDNDGLKDLFVANGFRKDVTNQDFASYNKDDYTYMFGTPQSKEKIKLADIKDMPEVKIHNFMYRNQGDLSFEDVSEKWGFSLPTFSNGTIYADLDNDGDLDLVCNNIDDDAILYENSLYKNNTSEKKSLNNYLRVKITASQEDMAKIYGAKVQLSIKGEKQYVEFNPYRGYKSTVEPLLHFGLGTSSIIDTLTVIWPDQKIHRQFNVPANQLITLNYAEANDEGQIPQHPAMQSNPERRLFEDKTDEVQLELTHDESEFIDTKITPMLHKQLSMDGPYLAVGDLNGDNLDDFVMGGDEFKATKIIWQQEEGTFKATSLPFDSLYEDQGILIFDANGDSHNDIYIVSGGSQFLPDHLRHQDRLYINNGSGSFTDATAEWLPKIGSFGSVVKGADFDNDGDVDLFVGGRLVSMKYPWPASSFILRNDGDKFTDVTREYAPALEDLGLVTDAIWFDYDNNGSQDLVVVGEWMPVTIFKNTNGKFTNTTATLGLEDTHGLYYSVQAADINKDGYADLVLGNNGLNSYYTASKEQPLEIFAKDFDENGTMDPVLTHYNQDKRYISLFRDAMNDQIIGTKKRFLKYGDFGRSTFDEAFSKSELEGAYHGVCNILSSFVLENKEGKTFLRHMLPAEAQFSTLRSMEIADLDGDGHEDLLISGNSYAEEPIRGWYDSSYGYFLSGDGAFNFKAILPSVSGFIADGDVRQLKAISIGGKKHFIISRNKGPVSIIALSGGASRSSPQLVNKAP